MGRLVTMRSEPTSFRNRLPAFDGDPVDGELAVRFEGNECGTVGPGRELEVEAGRRGTWIFEIGFGVAVPAGSRVGLRKIENEFRFDYIHQDYWPDARGYVTVEDAAGCKLPFRCDTALKSETPADLTLEREFGPDDAVVVRIGDQREGGSGVEVRNALYSCARMEAGVCLPGEEHWRPLSSGPVRVRVVAARPARRISVFAPSTHSVGTALTASAIFTDINGNAVAESDPDATVAGQALSCEAGELAAKVEWQEPVAGLHRIEVRSRDGQLIGESNPVRVTEDGPRIFWGEFHCHAFDGHELNVLNETTDPARAYRYGRDVTRLDFMALGSHIFRHAPEATEAWWELGREGARAADDPGRFVPFLGCEWRDDEAHGGDRNLVWRELDGPRPDPCWRIDDVYREMAAHDGMVTPHVGGAIAMPCCHGPGIEWMCEMTSGHGNFEWFAQAYLQKGYKVGLIGGSDGHKGTAGHPRMATMGAGRYANILRRRDAGWGGGPLLAVMADRLDRRTLWDAFRQRRVYASTGARALIAFRVNDQPMGSELKVDGEVRIDIDIEGTAPIARVDLIRGDRRRARWESSDRHFEASLTDRPPAGETYYYVRVEQADGEFLWTSPVWVAAAKGGEADALPAWNEPEDIDLTSISRNAAEEHREAVLHYLRTEEREDAFQDVTPYGVTASPIGNYAVFLCRLNGRRTRIHWFWEFELPRIRFEPGWVAYGRERVVGADWAEPVFPGQVML